MHTENYENLYRESIDNPESFWGKQAHKLAWYQKPQNILTQKGDGHYQWFEDGTLNTSYLALDYHIEMGRGEQNALIYDSPVTGTVKKYSFNELRDAVTRAAGALRKRGIEKGDRVIIYLPMIPEAVISMLACARLGAIHSVVFGGFAAHELAIRIDDAKPKALITANYGIEVDCAIPYLPIVRKALKEATHQPEFSLIVNRGDAAPYQLENDEFDFRTLCDSAAPADPVALKSDDPLYILYTSGTTGKPKGIVRENGGHAVALNFSMEYIYDCHPGEVFWAASDVGWVVGHSYITYAPLIRGCTTILFEGKPIKTPDASTFWRVISDHKVKAMFTAPTAIRAIKKEDPEGKHIANYDLSSLQYQFLAGERCDATTLHWLEEQLQIPVIDHWWQTESGWPMLAYPQGIPSFPVIPGSAGKPVCGYQIEILNEAGETAQPFEEGRVAVKLPLAPGMLNTIYNNHQRFVDGYLKPLPGYYLSGDGGYRNEDGYIFITGRIDDIINVSGHRLSTAEMEEVVAAVPGVAECAVIGIADDLKGQIPLALVVARPGHENKAALKENIVQKVRDEIGAVAALKRVVLIHRLPKTRSGKTLRRTMRAIADGKAYSVPSTIDDPAILSEIAAALGKVKA